jgi:hypothetical protein
MAMGGGSSGAFGHGPDQPIPLAADESGGMVPLS